MASISTIGEIMKGHFNELTGKEQDLSDRRMAICKKCPLYSIGKFGPRCNPDLWVNPKDQQDFSAFKIEGFIKGCGCRLEAKTRLSKKDGGVCPANFWNV